MAASLGRRTAAGVRTPESKGAAPARDAAGKSFACPRRLWRTPFPSSMVNHGASEAGASLPGHAAPACCPARRMPAGGYFRILPALPARTEVGDVIRQLDDQSTCHGGILG
jgi:hypothetical protein